LRCRAVILGVGALPGQDEDESREDIKRLNKSAKVRESATMF
jgi:hypothetical protein